MRLESKAGEDPVAEARAAAERSSKARSTMQLVEDNTDSSWSQIMWRVAMPLAALNLALLAIPLGAVNPRLGRSGDLLIAGLVGLLYMNMINLSRAWISSGKISFQHRRMGRARGGGAAGGVPADAPPAGQGAAQGLTRAPMAGIAMRRRCPAAAPHCAWPSGA